VQKPVTPTPEPTEENKELNDEQMDLEQASFSSETESDFSLSEEFTSRKSKKQLSKKSRLIRKAPRTKQLRVKQETEDEEGFACKVCRKTFDTSQQLGGHTSKMHPGKSASYNNKIDTWQSRKF